MANSTRYGRARRAPRDALRWSFIRLVCGLLLCAFTLLNIAALMYNVAQLQLNGDAADAAAARTNALRRPPVAHTRVAPGASLPAVASGGAAPRTGSANKPMPSWYGGMPAERPGSSVEQKPLPDVPTVAGATGCKRDYDAWQGTEFVGGAVTKCGDESCCRAKGAGSPCYYTAPYRECFPVTAALTAEAIEKAVRSVGASERSFDPAVLQSVLGITEQESALVDLYAHAKVKRVERLKKSGKTSWANGHDNRLWLLYFEDESLEPAIFKTAVIDMAFVKYDARLKDAQMYDKHNPPAFYINCEFSPLLWINEFIAWALDRTLGAGLTPPTSIRRFTIDEFVRLFGPHVLPNSPEDLRAALLKNPFKVSVLLCTVTFHANHAHNLTRSP